MTLKVLHISTGSTGGAAISAIRLHVGLLRNGFDSSIMFFNPPTKNIPRSSFFKKGYSLMDRFLSKLNIKPLPQKLHQQRIARRKKGYSPFSFADIGYDITTHPQYDQADIINFHWIGKFVDLPSFFRKNSKPVVWTLHDMNAFTGGCHYSGSCFKFADDCAACVQLEGTSNSDAAQLGLQAKLNAIPPDMLHIVSPSIWLLRLAKESKAFGNVKSFHHIPYGIDTSVYRRVEKNLARTRLNLPHGKKILLFVSLSTGNQRKGFDILLDSIKKIKDHKDVLLVSVGRVHQSEAYDNLISLGHIQDESTLALVYSAADLMIIPSREDNFPNVILESMSCGTPVAGFAIGGLPDIINHGVTGLLTEMIRSESLSQMIIDFLDGKYHFNSELISDFIAQNFSLSMQGEKYQSLYETIRSK